jgi:hypothetical protein
MDLKPYLMKSAILYLLLLIFILPVRAQKTEVFYLSGLDKDHTVQWDFFCTKGRNSGKWSKIAVPSNWELQGFGTYNYGRDRQFADEQGLYKFQFKAPQSFRNKKVFIVDRKSVV